jgi:parvulin-like peptidyl-prolyl isomerase
MSDQVRASHILLMYEGSASSSATRSKEEAVTEIGELRAQIEGGATFADVARDNSDCPSGAQGGDLGMFGRGQMVPEFETATYAMSVGDLSEVIETSFGYHIIQRTE